MLPLVASGLLSLLLAWGSAGRAEEFQPIPAAEAEVRVTEAREAVVDVLWMGTEPFWHRGDWESCVRLCRQVVEVDPHFVEAGTSLAWLLWSHDRDAEAIAAYEECITANPESWQARHEYGMYYFARKKWDKAVEQFREARKLGAPTPHAHMLPIALERAGRKEEALAEWRALVDSHPDDLVARRRLQRLERELTPSPSERR